MQYQLTIVQMYSHSFIHSVIQSISPFLALSPFLSYSTTVCQGVQWKYLFFINGLSLKNNVKKKKVKKILMRQVLLDDVFSFFF